MENQQQLNGKCTPVLLYWISSFKGNSCKKFQDIGTSLLFLVVLHQLLYQKILLFTRFLYQMGLFKGGLKFSKLFFEGLRRGRGEEAEDKIC